MAANRRARKAGADLRIRPIGKLDWSPPTYAESVQAVFATVTSQAVDSINWYLHSKRSKKRWALLLRFLAIFSTALAGLIPIVAELDLLTDETTNEPLISPLWSTLALGIAAAFIGFDRFGGFSRGWMRYVTTELKIRMVLDEFRLAWHARQLTWHGGNPSQEQADAGIAVCREFLAAVNSLVEQETAQWVAEFQNALRELDQAAETLRETTDASAASARPGAVEGTVANGHACAAGWTLKIGGDRSRDGSGNTCSVANVAPGLHTVAVEGEIDGAPRRAETIVTVPPGGIATFEVTLT